MYHTQNHDKILQKNNKKSDQVTRTNTRVFHQILLSKNIIKRQGHYQAPHGNLFGIFKRLLGKIRGANINK
jgi:hypothetical protein